MDNEKILNEIEEQTAEQLSEKPVKRSRKKKAVDVPTEPTEKVEAETEPITDTPAEMQVEVEQEITEVKKPKKKSVPKQKPAKKSDVITIRIARLFPNATSNISMKPISGEFKKISDESCGRIRIADTAGNPIGWVSATEIESE